MGKVATSPLPPRGSPPLQSGGAQSEVAHKWARWLHHPCRLGDPHRFRAGGKIRNVKKRAEMQRHPCIMGGSLAKGTKSKVAELGARAKLWMCSPKEYHQKQNRTNDVSASKNTLKTPLGPFLKKGGGFQNPPRYRISQKPPLAKYI